MSAQSDPRTPRVVEIPPTTTIERTPENDAIYRAIRGEINAELALITARVNWLIASQAFLFTPLVMGTDSDRISDSVLFPAIPVLGLLLCGLILTSIIAAVWRSRQWRRKARHGAYVGDTGKDDFSFVLPHTPQIPLLGMIGCLGVPAVLIACWLALLVAPVFGG